MSPVNRLIRTPCATGDCDTRPPILRDLHESPVSQRHRVFLFGLVAETVERRPEEPETRIRAPPSPLRSTCAYSATERGEAWHRAWSGTRRAPVQIRPF